MSFSREDLAAYAAKPQVQSDSHDPWEPAKVETEPQVKVEADVNSAIDASITESAEPDKPENDGSTTETKAETVAAEIANPEGAKDPDLEDDTDGVRPRSRAQERIEELVAERNALRRYGEHLLGIVEGSRKPSTETASQAVQDKTPEDEAAPTLENADYDPVKFSKMQSDWINKQVDKRVETVVKQLETRQSESAVRQAFESRTVEFRKNAPDFDTVLSNPALPQLAPDAAKVVVRSDQGPAIAYHLGKNPDLATRISRMEPISQIAAIGRLEEQLSRVTQKEPSKVTTVAPKVTSVTKAPPPPKPVSSGTGVVQKPGDIMSMDEWVANERKISISLKQEKLKLRQALRR